MKTKLLVMKAKFKLEIVKIKLVVVRNSHVTRKVKLHNRKLPTIKGK